jgi:hypothetical protein
MAVSFSNDIAGLFTERDLGCMARAGVELNSYAYMSSPVGDANFGDHAHARHVLARVRGDETPQMPPGGPAWDDAKIALMAAWIDGGYQP